MEDRYEKIKQHFRAREGIDVSAGRGAQGIKANSKMFVMFFKGDLLLRLPPERVTELINEGAGEAYDPGTGPMKDRVIVRHARRARWIPLSEESHAYVSGN